jgi:hypothetical protein
MLLLFISILTIYRLQLSITLFYYLFAFIVFNDAVSNSDCTESNDGMINELERIWKEAAEV